MMMRSAAAAIGCALLLSTALVAAPEAMAATAKSAKKSDEPPPGVRVAPPPGQKAEKPAAKKPSKKVAKSKKKKKKRSAKRKGKVKSGRAAASDSPLAGIDKNQLAVDHLSDAGKKSTLALLKSYKETLRDGDFETAAILLRLAAGETPDRKLIVTVNDLLGVPLDTTDTQVLLEVAQAARADAVAGDINNPDAPKPVDSPVGARIHAAHAAVAETPQRSRIAGLRAYKQAIALENPEAAALALAALVETPLAPETVAAANELLGIEGALPADQIVATAAPAP